MNRTHYRLILIAGLVLLASAAAWPTAAGAPRQQSVSQPRIVVGTYETTNPIYPLIGAETGVLLYDLAGEIQEDYAFIPAAESQVVGELLGDIVSGSYAINLPDDPHGTLLDFDDDPSTPPAVQVYAPATYIKLLGNDLINRGEGPLDLSVRIAPFTFDVVGGYVVVWAADDDVLFPSSFGDDGAVFTSDDPLMPLPAGWSVIELDSRPFSLIRNEMVEIPVVESVGALNDYADLSYEDAWEQLFERTRITYPFAEEKNVNWNEIYDAITPLVAQADSDLEFHLVMTHFGAQIPDTHIGYFSLPVVQSYLMGGVGISHLDVTDSGDVVVLDVRSNSPADAAGIVVGSVLLEVDGDPALQVLEETPLLFNSASTPHGRRYWQASIMLQGPVDSAVDLTWRIPDGEVLSARLVRQMDIMSLLKVFDSESLSEDVIAARMLDSGLGYIAVRGFAKDVSTADARFGAELQNLIDAGATGIIIDVRDNGGGLVQLSMSMAGHFFQDYVHLFDFHYADGEGDFAYRGYIEILKSEPYYDGPVAVLVNTMTGSASDMFAYAMTYNDRAVVVGHSPTGGFTGGVGDGQYSLPGKLTMQIPTSRPVDPVTGETLLEGKGVEPDVRVPVTLENLLSPEDDVLLAAEAALLGQQ